MTENPNSAIHLLELPLEILEEILSFVPDQMTVAQTCQTFYDISCQLKSYKITVQRYNFYDHPAINFNKLEENASLLESIVNSKRKIVAINLSNIDFPELKCHKSVKMLFETFGRNLSELRLEGCKVTLEQFSNRSDVAGCFQLDLPKLRELIVEYCPLQVLEVFNHLPDNNLTKVVVKRCRGNVENVLRNQKNIKELSWSGSDILAINTRNLQLRSLELTEDCYSREVLIGQGSLTSLTLPFGLQQADIDTISTLEHLDYLKFNINRFLNLSELQKLSKLERLNVNIERDIQSFGTLKSSSLNDLIVDVIGFDREFAVTLSQNCPNIRKLKIVCYEKMVDPDDPGTQFLSSLLEKFPDLESFSTALPVDFNFPVGFVHRNLKRLRLECLSYSFGFQTLLEGCVGLELFETIKIDCNLLKTILTARPTLKVLCVNAVDRFDVEFIYMFWELGRNLESLHIKQISAEEAEEKIKEQFLEYEGKLPYLALMKAMRAKKICCKK